MSGSVSGYLGFDPTDADSIAASAKIGSYLIGASGTVIGSVGDALKVSASIDFAGDYAEDSAHTSSDVGLFSLGVRRDTRSSGVGSDGDYASLNLNNVGELWVKDADVLAQLVSGVTVSGTVELGATTLAALETIELGATTLAALESITVQNGSGASAVNIQDGGNSITVDFIDPDLANTAIENTATAVTSTVGPIVTAALPNRKDVFIANMGANLVYFGKAGVTAANGFPIFKNEKLQARIGAAVAPGIITASGTASIRVMELS